MPAGETPELAGLPANQLDIRRGRIVQPDDEISCDRRSTKLV
jgi:hypothetical protein